MALRPILPLPGTRAPTHNLLASADHVYVGDGDWMNGAQVKSEACISSFAFEVSCPPPLKSPPQTCPEVVMLNPLGLEVTITRPRVGHDLADVEKLAIQQLDVASSSLMEKALWAGPFENSQTVVTLSAPATVIDALGAMEAVFLDAFADHAGQGGTIYMSPDVAALCGGQIREINDDYPYDDHRFYTKSTGSLVIIGNFPSTGIRGHLGRCDAYLSDITTYQADDAFKTNEHIVQAERLGLVVFEPCKVWHINVVVPAPVDPGGGPPTAPLDVPITLGLTGPGGAAEVGGGPQGGVRVEPARGGTPIPMSEIKSIDWGDGNVDDPADTSGGFVAHIYTQAATGVSITVTTTVPDTGTSSTFNVV
jgi:hypothetical protein